MGLLEIDTFVCLDCETTGLEPTEDRLIEIGLMIFTFKEIQESYETLIDPQRPIPEVTIAIHHITDEMVESARQKKQDERGGFDGRIFVAYADIPKDSATYDYCMKQPDKYPIIDVEE